MAKKPLKAYRVSFTLSLLVTAFVVFLNALLLFLFTDEDIFSKDKLTPLLLSIGIIFPVCFIVFYYRIEAYAYKQVKNFTTILILILARNLMISLSQMIWIRSLIM